MDKVERYKHYHVGEDFEEMGTDDLQPILSMCVNTLTNGRKPVYANSSVGLEEFKNKSIEYFQYIIDVNARPEVEKRLIPDIESLSVYLGITRMTLLTYEKTRGGEWSDLIGQIKNMIASAKKQLIMTGKIPAIIGIFDLTNNHNYVNASEFKIIPDTDNKQNHLRTIEQIQEELGLTFEENQDIVLPDADF